MRAFERCEITALIVPECKWRADALRALLGKFGLKIACCTRPPNPEREGPTGGGVSVVVRNDTILRTCAASPLGALWARIEPSGSNPFNIIAFYMPTTGSKFLKRFPLAREMILEWADICINRIEKSPVPTWMAAGDFNVSLGCPRGMGRRAAVKAKRGESRVRGQLLAWMNRHNLIPTHGTLLSEGEAEHTSTGAAGLGLGEPDYIFVKRGSVYSIIRSSQERREPRGMCHRMVSCLITVPPPLTPQQRPARGGAPTIHLPQYGDMRAWEEHGKQTASWMREKGPTLLQPGTDPAAMLDILIDSITETAAKCFSAEPKRHRRGVLRLYQGRDIPPRAAEHFARRRRLRQEASARASCGDAKGAQHKRLQAQLARRRGIKAAESAWRSRLGYATSDLYKRDASGFFKILRDGASNGASPDGHDIPNSPDGTPASDSFAAKAAELFSKAPGAPPAISVEKDFWMQYIPRPQPTSVIPDPPDPARLATVPEMYHILYGVSDTYPPVECSQSCLECKKRIAQYAAYKEGKANRINAALKGSKSPGGDGVHAELLGWLRDVRIDDPDGIGTRATMASIMCDLFNKMLETGSVPEGFTQAKIIPLLKPTKPGVVADKSAFSSYRLLALRNIFDKVVKLLINSRVLHHVMIHGITGEVQNGFLPNLSTEDPIFVMTHLLQRLGNPDNPLYTVYIDILRAYDNVDHEALCVVLETAGIPPKLVRLLRAMMNESFGTLHINGVASAPIRLSKGVPQGDPLSCLLFAIFIASLPRYLSSVEDISGAQCLGTVVKLMLYADDGSSPCVSKAQADLTIEHCHRWAKAWRLEMNTGHGKTMYTAHDGGAFDTTGSPVRGPDELGPVEMAQEGYLYLGALFTNTINWDAISADHTQKVWGAYMGLRHNSSIVRNLSMAQQLQLMKVFLAPYLQAFSPVRPTAPSLVLAARRRVEALSNVIRLPANASHLLLHTIGGAPTELAHRLRERLRLFLHFACHPSRKQDPTICVPTSVRLFSGLLQEATQCIANNIRPKAYNWVHESLLAAKSLS